MLPRKAKKELELEQKEQQKELIWLQQYWEQTTEQGVEKAFTTKELYYIGVTELILFKLFKIFPYSLEKRKTWKTIQKRTSFL